MRVYSPPNIIFRSSDMPMKLRQALDGTERATWVYARALLNHFILRGFSLDEAVTQTISALKQRGMIQ